jgi:hypothetical protein
MRRFETGMEMKSLRALFATTTLLAGIGASDAAIRIVDDPGGRIRTYVDRYESVRISGETVIIDGYVPQPVPSFSGLFLMTGYA